MPMPPPPPGPVPAPKGLSQMLMVSTAHIHWDPQLPDVKLVQTMMLVEELQKFVKVGTHTHTHIDIHTSYSLFLKSHVIS